jgi:hypothetical protein
MALGRKMHERDIFVEMKWRMCELQRMHRGAQAAPERCQIASQEAA